MSDKTKTIEIGKTASGESVELDLYKFIQTRAMIQASSGGGKSWLARVIAEKTLHAEIPVWTIDPEGEYVTLREKFEIVIFGASDDADLPADENTLQLVLPELFARNVSVVFDLSEHSLEEKQTVAAAVCTFLLSIPKPDQKPILLVVDEAQVLAPEREITTSGKALSDVASRGRKRALGLLVATQRLSALNKNLTTQLQNRFVGFCREDIEISRAADLIGKVSAQELPDFEPGDFFAVGGALSSRKVVRFHSAPVETTHPDASVFGQTKPAVASEGLSELLKVLREKLITDPADLQPEDSDSLDEIKKREKRLLDWEKSIEERETEFLKDYRIIENFKPQVFKEIETVFAEARQLLNVRLDELKRRFERVFKVPEAELKPVLNGEKNAENIPSDEPPVQKTAPALQKTKPQSQKTENMNLPPAQQKILGSLRVFEKLGLATAHRANVAALAGYSHSSGSYGGHLAQLKSGGLIEYAAGGHLRLTDKARQFQASFPIPEINSNEQLHDSWFRILNSAESAILRVLIEFNPKTISRELIGHNTGYSHSSGSFGGHLAHLKSLGLIEYGNTENGIRGARATSLLFPFGEQNNAKH